MKPTNSKAKDDVRADYQKGFTLAELLSVIVIMGVMVSVVIKKVDLLSDSAGITALRSGIRELIQEKL